MGIVKGLLRSRVEGAHVAPVIRPVRDAERRDQRGEEEKEEAVATPADLNRGRGRRYTSLCTSSEERMTSKDVVAEWLAGA